jgi:hypothetical protein
MSCVRMRRTPQGLFSENRLQSFSQNRPCRLELGIDRQRPEQRIGSSRQVLLSEKDLRHLPRHEGAGASPASSVQYALRTSHCTSISMYAACCISVPNHPLYTISRNHTHTLLPPLQHHAHPIRARRIRLFVSSGLLAPSSVLHPCISLQPCPTSSPPSISCPHPHQYKTHNMLVARRLGHK